MKIDNYTHITNLYDLLWGSSQSIERDSQFLHSEILKHYNVSSIYDPACGTGNPSVGLANIGYNVTVSDLSLDMLNQCRKKAKDENVNLRFIDRQLDWRDLTNRLSEKFDAIIIFGNSFYHLADDKSKTLTLKNIYRLLHEKGICIIDFLQWDENWKRLNFPEYKNYGDYAFNGEMLNIYRIYSTENRKQVDTLFFMKKENNIPTEIIAAFQSIGWAFSSQEIESLARNAGFQNVYFKVRTGTSTPVSVMIAQK